MVMAISLWRGPWQKGPILAVLSDFLCCNQCSKTLNLSFFSDYNNFSIFCSWGPVYNFNTNSGKNRHFRSNNTYNETVKYCTPPLALKTLNIGHASVPNRNSWAQEEGLPCLGSLGKPVGESNLPGLYDFPQGSPVRDGVVPLP